MVGLEVGFTGESLRSILDVMSFGERERNRLVVILIWHSIVWIL